MTNVMLRELAELEKLDEKRKALLRTVRRWQKCEVPNERLFKDAHKYAKACQRVDDVFEESDK